MTVRKNASSGSSGNGIHLGPVKLVPITLAESYIDLSLAVIEKNLKYSLRWLPSGSTGRTE
jgi:hypothetical protein